MKKQILYSLSFILGVALVTLATQYLPFSTELKSVTAYSDSNAYSKVQHVFDQRCVVCHSCNNAPCQLKLGSFEGLMRGASKSKVYDGGRTSMLPTTRLGIDAHSTAEWRKMGFSSVTEPGHELFLEILKRRSTDKPNDAPLESNYCAANETELDQFVKTNPNKLMPYGLPPLQDSEIRILTDWVAAGALPPEKKAHVLMLEESVNLKTAQSFFNQTDNEHRLVARYLFEHLFLANIRFAEASSNLHRLVRSSTPCSEGISEIPTRRPSDDPGSQVNYCFREVHETIVEKTLMPYLLDSNKIERFKQLFFSDNWKVEELPGYSASTAVQPFETYASIPVKARYQFLLDDSQYEVATFIKGPVCSGGIAVNAIDEHFNVFFFKPESDLLVKDSELYRRSARFLTVPAIDGSNIELAKGIADIPKFIDLRNSYRKMVSDSRRAHFPNGYTLNDLWDGDGSNDNAVLTIFRHFDHAKVMKGLRGGPSSSYMLLDYALFERLVYNLVVGFDVFGNLSHQLNTRAYMGLIRREGEENYLLFMPESQREKVRKNWYQSNELVDQVVNRGLLPGLAAAITRQKYFDNFPSSIKLGNTSRPDLMLAQKIAKERLAPNVRGRFDSSNLSEVESFNLIAQKPGAFVRGFPDSVIVLIQQDHQTKRLVTLIRDKARYNLGTIFLEQQGRKPEADHLAVVDGLATSFPNLIFLVEQAQLNDMIVQLSNVTSAASWKDFLNRWALSTKNPAFWPESDALYDFLQRSDPIHAGVLDFTRYGVWTEPVKW